MMPDFLLMAMKPWRNAREGNTGIATNGHCLLAKRWTNSELEYSATSNSSPPDMRSKIGRGSSMRNEVEIDAVRLHFAGIERLHAVIERAGKTQA